MVRINCAAIRGDFRRNWLVFLLGAGLGAFTLTRSEFRAPVLGMWIFAAILALAIGGLIARYAWRGWLEFGRG